MSVFPSGYWNYCQALKCSHTPNKPQATLTTPGAPGKDSDAGRHGLNDMLSFNLVRNTVGDSPGR